MIKMSPMLLGLSLALAGSSLALAQDAPATPSTPTVLQITREYLKPYKSGAAHDKTESAFVQAQARAKFPVYYTALNSMSGKSRALFMTRYDSFADWEKANTIVAKNPTLSNDFERAGLADGELLDELDSVVFTYDADLSYHSRRNLEDFRYYELMVFKIKLGHRKEWHELVKMVKDGHDKAGTSAHWGCYDLVYGGDDGTYLIITGDKSMADIDNSFAESKKWVEAMGGEEGLNKFDRLYGEAVESSHTELFSVNAKQSYVSEEWIKAAPDFWKPKAAAAAPAKSAAKPAAAKP
jgi:hypothetical protein